MKRLCVALAILLFASSTKANVSPGQVGTTVLNSCGTNITDPICRNLSIGRQYLDHTMRYWMKQYGNEAAIIASGVVTQAIISRKLTFYLSRDAGYGKPSLLIDQHEVVTTFKWSF